MKCTSRVPILRNPSPMEQQMRSWYAFDLLHLILLHKFQVRVKSHAEKLLFPSGVASYPPSRLRHPEVMEVIDFMQGLHSGPTVERFSIDVTSGRSSNWNLRACQVFSYDFCAREYPEASGKTHVDVFYEFYRLLPSFLWLHAETVGFGCPQRLERFHEIFARQVRKYKVWFTIPSRISSHPVPKARRSPNSNRQRDPGASRVPAHRPSPCRRRRYEPG